MRSPVAPSRSNPCRGAAAVELVLTVVFLLMGILASTNFARQYHAHAKAMEEARVNAWSGTSSTHTSRNVFDWVGNAYGTARPGDPSELGKTHNDSPEAPLDGAPASTGEPEFDVKGAEGTAEYGVFGHVVGMVDMYTGESTKRLKGIFLLDPAMVSRGGVTDIWAKHVVCRNCYIDPEPLKERGWMTIDTLSWLTNSIKGFFDWLISSIADPVELLKSLDVLLPIPLDPEDWKYD